MAGDTTNPTGSNQQAQSLDAETNAALATEKRRERTLGVYLLILPILLTCLLVAIWPSPFTPPGKTVPEIRSLWNFTDQVEVRLLMIVLVSGALGSAVSAARTYANFHGLGRYEPSWTWWYLMKVPIGMGLALFLYLVVRGGLFSASLSDSGAVMDTANPFGFAALGALAGMFAKEASDKLEEIFKAVFRTAEKPPVARPKIDRLDPAAKKVHDPDLTLKVEGSGFDAKSTVKVGDKTRDSVFKNAGLLVVTLSSEDLERPGKLPVVVVAGTQGGGTSAAVELAVAG
ncbi:hypothetical protein C0075_10910 [Rhizobium sp. KAs_5_22]|uniref:hypothetical protein n=1 Tax=Ciceribacter selenitireducens TaxID=448181 RepID=UPI0004B96AA5|nr:hypothetical protein [Ciceribacter selenitireducens]PPJ46202.1 hypothetical protein C0075_10910 [Rhizobium sp. KAs_5_22]